MGYSNRLQYLQHRYLDSKRKEKERRKKIYYNELITEKLLLSDPFMEEK